MEQKQEELAKEEKEIERAEKITQNNQDDFYSSENQNEEQNQHEDNKDANLNKESSTLEVSTAQNYEQSLHVEQSHSKNVTQMSEQITESEAIRLLCSTETQKEVIEKHSKTEKEVIEKHSETEKEVIEKHSKTVPTPPRSTEIGIEQKSVMQNESVV